LEQILNWTKSHLNAYLATAEVILEWNVDPGEIQYFLLPTLERCGMWGGIWYHASVKTNIFSNLVVSLLSLPCLSTSFKTIMCASQQGCLSCSSLKSRTFRSIEWSWALVAWSFADSIV
jgi:hypothetical protein